MGSSGRLTLFNRAVHEVLTGIVSLGGTSLYCNYTSFPVASPKCEAQANGGGGLSERRAPQQKRSRTSL